MRAADDSRQALALGVALAFITLALYWPVRNYDYIGYDDPDYVFENPLVLAGLTWESVVWSFTGSHSTNWHPLTTLSHLMDVALFGPVPGPHHVVNILWHTAATIMLFLALRQLTGSLWRSAFVAALFAWHPLHVESVAWISERKDVLCGFFWMLTIWYYAGYARQPTRNSYLAALASFGCAVMAKPMAVTLPFVLMLLDFWPLRRTTGDRTGSFTDFWRSSAPLLREKAPFFALSAAASLITFLVQRGGGAVISTEQVSLPLRLANAVVSYVRYLGKAFWPVDLAVYYPHPLEWPIWAWGGALMVIALLMSATLWQSRRFPFLATGLFWFLGALVPVIGLVQTGGQAMADRYTYLPLIGIFIATGWGGWEAAKNLKVPRLAIAASSVSVLVACLALTAMQLRYWRNTQALFEHALEVTERNLVAHLNLGVLLDKSGQPTRALKHFEAAVKLNPESPEVHLNLGTAMENLGRLDEAITRLHTALRLRPGYPDAHNALGNVLDRQGNHYAAAQHYQETLRLNPDHAKAHSNLALLLARQNRIGEARDHYAAALRLNPFLAEAHAGLGFVLARQRDREGAFHHFTEALRLKPSLPEACAGLGLALAGMNHFAEAIPYLTEAARLSPDDPQAEFQLAIALEQQGQVAAAMEHFRNALKLNPAMPAALDRLAWMHATSKEHRLRNGAEALALARKACTLTAQQQPGLLNTLGAAQAETGDFDTAIGTANRALQLAQQTGSGELATHIERCLRSYEARQPWRE